MTEIEAAERNAMRVLNGWVDAMMPKFNAIEMMALKQRLTAAFREYETALSGPNEMLNPYADKPGCYEGSCFRRGYAQGRIAREKEVARLKFILKTVGENTECIGLEKCHVDGNCVHCLTTWMEEVR